MLLNRTTQTAISAMSRLAETYADADSRLSSRDIAESRNLPAPIVAKILTELSRAGWVEGSPGPHGGYRMAVSPQDVTLQDIVTLFERESDLSCPFGPDWCGNGAPCPMHHDLKAMREQQLDYCQRTTFAVFQSTTEKPQAKIARRNRPS